MVHEHHTTSDFGNAVPAYPVDTPHEHLVQSAPATPKPEDPPIMHTGSTVQCESSTDDHQDPPLLESYSVPDLDFFEPNIAKRKIKNEVRKRRQSVKNQSRLDWLLCLLPCIPWIKEYKVKEWLLWDVMAGLSVGFMVIPQGMSYANLAGLPGVYGLYGAFIPNIVYGLLGSSRQLAVGPVAVTSLLLGTGLQDMFDGKINDNPNDPKDICLQDNYNRAAIQVAFLAGLMYTAVGIFRMGFITNFLSHSVISGFMSGASITIALSQVKYILGLKIPRADVIIEQMHLITSNLNQFSWREFLMGTSWMILLIAMRKLSQKFPRLVFLRAIGPITVTVLGIALMEIFKWYNPAGGTSTTTSTTTPASPPSNSTALANGTLTNATSTALANVTSNVSLAVAAAAPAAVTKAAKCVTTVSSCLANVTKCLSNSTTSNATKCLSTASTCVATAASCLTPTSSATNPCTRKVTKAASVVPRIKPVGTIPKGLPHFTAGWFFPLIKPGKQIGLAILICCIDLCESLSIAKALAQKHRYELHATQELCALGIANLAGALFNCYTTTGSFSRSAVNDSVGAQSRLSCFVTGLLLLLTLACLTGVFVHMPQNVQGAIIIVGVLNLFQINEFFYLLKANLFDALVWLVAFFCVVFLGVDVGLGISIGLSVIIVVFHAAFPYTTRLGRLPDTTMYRNVKQYSEAQETEGVLVFRVDAPLFFANVQYIKEWVRSQLRKSEVLERPLTGVVLDLSPVTHVDASAVHGLSQLLHELRSNNQFLFLANPSIGVMSQLRRGHFIDDLGEDAVFVSTHNAVTAASHKLNSRCLSLATV
eukprot:TRINITY_DN2444_c0_g1_i1.p1 TRINITY_DN2444_c0_g1~~TRINITY_DN2444_c0_g1_i1.p1  ORF type:complete len:820 (+),score=110.82 TRINITY_DN2444_c0_g1_i1:35-2494(+)